MWLFQWKTGDDDPTYAAVVKILSKSEVQRQKADCTSLFGLKRFSTSECIASSMVNPMGMILGDFGCAAAEKVLL